MLLDQRQAEEVEGIYSRIGFLFVLTQLLVGCLIALLWIIVFSLLFGPSNMILALAAALPAAAVFTHLFFTTPFLNISALSSYESDRSLEDCWEDMRSMDGYAVRNFGHAEAVDRKDDELIFEVTYPQFMGHTKRTMMCRRSEEKPRESMRVDLFVDGKPVGYDLIRVGRVGDKSVVEYETTYSSKLTLSDYLLYRIIGRYTPKIARALGYRKRRKGQKSISLR